MKYLFLLLCLIFAFSSLNAQMGKTQVIFHWLRIGPILYLQKSISENGINLPTATPILGEKYNRIFQNFQLGTGFTLYKPGSALGFGLDGFFVNRAVNISRTQNGQTQELNHQALGASILPLFKIRFGDQTKRNGHFMLLLGGQADYYLDYQRSSEDATLNSDINNINPLAYRGVGGIAWNIVSGARNDVSQGHNGWTNYNYSSKDAYWEFQLRYHHEFSSLFNTSYTENGVRPYAGWSSQFGFISFSIVARGSLESVSSK